MEHFMTESEFFAIVDEISVRKGLGFSMAHPALALLHAFADTVLCLSKQAADAAMVFSGPSYASEIRRMGFRCRSILPMVPVIPDANPESESSGISDD